MASNFNIYEAITNRITNALKEKNIPWEKEWIGTDAYTNHFNGKPYSLLNQIMLAAQNGNPGSYASFKQWTEHGYKIKKGAKAKMVTFWKMLDDKDDEDKKIPMLKYYNVFSWEDVTDADGNDLTLNKTGVEIPSNSLDDLLKGYYTAEGITYSEGGNRAYYRPSKDSITLPKRDSFKSESGYYSTKAHETIHSTGAENRLKRFENAKFGDEKYALEELVAEIGANFLLTMYGVNTEKSDRNTDAYCKGWAKVLKDNPRWIVSAASRAEKAVTYIEEHQAEITDEETVDEFEGFEFEEEPKAKKDDTITYYVAMKDGSYQTRKGKLDGDSMCAIEKRVDKYVATDYCSGMKVTDAPTKKELLAKLNKMADKLSALRATDKYMNLVNNLKKIAA